MLAPDRRSKCSGEASQHPPVLTYHRIAQDGPAALAPYRVAPEMFERQLSWLQSNGYRSGYLDAYLNDGEKGRSHGCEKSVVLTFDDAYEDFYSTAWPLLRRHGFGATVFVPTGRVGGRAEWDTGYGSAAAIMSWNQIRELHAQGVRFGSHGHTHAAATRFGALRALWEAIVSRTVLNRMLSSYPSEFCYPFGVSYRVTRIMVALAGYDCAVGGSLPSGRQSQFCIPRIEILGDDSLESFASKVADGVEQSPPASAAG